MADRTDWVVDGFQFGTKKDAELAQKEQLRIERLEEKIDYSNPHMVHAVYKKAVDNRVFKTPVGYGFLKKLQDNLRENPPRDGEEIADIPVSGVFSLRESTAPAAERIKASPKKKEKPTKEASNLRISLLVNAALLLLVIVMFAISTTGSNPTVLNYEKTLQNRYSEWEQQLSEREAAIREKEKELLLAE